MTATAPIDDRPLVTFALFAYNQEKYIREAVDGAFSQNYQPLEIILSDDCSSDRTYEIMQEMAAAYIGPHEVRVVRTERNLGVVPHVLLRGRESSGDIIVVAAGDDVSLPHRVEHHVRRYDDSSVMGASGAFDLIDAEGLLISSGETRPVALSSARTYPSYFLNTLHQYRVIQGSTASYRKKVFEFPLPEWPIRFSEDNLLNFLIYANDGRVDFIELALVKYRFHARALNNKGKGKLNLADHERETLSAARRNINKMETFIWIKSQARTHRAVIDGGAISESLRRSREMVNWGNFTVGARLKSIALEVLLYKSKMLKWKVVRIFGKFPNYQPKTSISRFQRSYI